MAETQAGPTDSYYKFLKEKNKREKEGVEALLSQELALIEDNVVIADLNLLRAEGTFSGEEREIPKDQAQYEQAFSLRELEGSNSMYSLQDTDWDSIDEFILKYFQESSGTVGELDISSIKNLDPAVAATLAYAITKHFMIFDEEMEQNPAGEKAMAANTQSADKLLVEKHGICRHFTKVAIAIYDRLKQIDESGSLTDTVLLPVGNTLMDDIPGPHAYCLLIAKRTETVLSIGDPTFLKTMDREVHSNLRLASLVSTLIEKHLLTVLDIKEETLLAIIDIELSRLDKWVNLEKKLTTGNSDQGLNNASAILEQGFDERTALFFTEATSVLQLIYALNTAKSMLEKPDYGGIVSRENMESGAQSMFDWVIWKSEQLPLQATVGGIIKMLDIAPQGIINLELFTSILTALKDLLTKANGQLEQALYQKLQFILNGLKNDTMPVYSDDPWGAVGQQRKYSEEKTTEAQLLLNDLANK